MNSIAYSPDNLSLSIYLMIAHTESVRQNLAHLMCILA